MAAFLSTLPPQMAITGLGCEVKNVVWSHLSAGGGGGEQLLVLGKTSREGSQEPPANPPASKRTLSSEPQLKDLGIFVSTSYERDLASLYHYSLKAPFSQNTPFCHFPGVA